MPVNMSFTEVGSTVLSNPNGSASGPTTAIGLVTTTDGINTLYMGAWLAGQNPTDTEVMNGTNSYYSANNPTPTVGVNSWGVTGLDDDTNFELHFLQNGVRAKSPVFLTPQLGAGSITLNTILPTRLVAPCPVYIRTTGYSGFALGSAISAVDIPGYHEVDHLWNTGDTGTWDAPENMVAVWNDKSLSNAVDIGHVYDTPGTYQPSVIGTDRSGGTGNGTASSITVVDADTVYTGTATICIALDGNFAGAPSGAQQVTSLAAAQTAVDNNGNGTPTRLLFKRGETYDDCELDFRNAAVEYCGPWGSGAKPILNARRFVGDGGTTMFSWFANDSSQQVIVTELDMRGDWNPVGETGYTTQVPFDCWGLDVNDTFFLVHSCRLEGLSRIDISHTNGGRPANTLFVNNDVVGWQDYGCFFQRNANLTGSNLCILGNKIVQDPNARDGFYRKNYAVSGNRHGPVRFEVVGSFHLGCNDLFSNSGWSEISPGQAIQACVRINTFPSLCYGARGSVERNVMEGGAEVVNMAGENSGSDESPGNYLIDRNLFVGGSKSAAASLNSSMVTAAYGGTTIRNCYFYLPNSPHYHDVGNDSSYPLGFHQHDPIPENGSARMDVYNNTILNGRNAANDQNFAWQFTNTSGQFTNGVYENNIVIAETIDTPVGVGDAPLGAAAFPGITLRYPGVIEGVFPIVGSLNVADDAYHAIPYPYGTTQADWTPHTGTDTLHTIRVGTNSGHSDDNGGVSSGTSYHGGAGDVEIDVSQASEMRIYNRSGVTWNGDFEFKPDMTSQISPDATYATPPSLPLPIPGVASDARDDATSGLVSRTDFFGVVRPSPANRGAFEDA